MVEVPETAGVARHDTLATRLAGFARRSPQGTAIVSDQRRLTWSALDREVSALAGAIAAATGGRRGNVCVLLHDRMAAVEAILAIVRSGCVYVPFDPDDTDARLRFMLVDSEPIAVVAAGPSLARARALAPPGCAIVDPDALPDAIAPDRCIAAHGDDLAHIYYTSGSTGQPKGVCQTHANQLHFADAYQRRVGVGEGDRQSLLYSIGYAAALGDIYRGIGLGATLCLYDVKANGIGGLADWADREKVNLLHTFPMVFREMAKRIDAARVLPHLDVLQLDGEPLYASDVALYRAHTAARCKLVHQLSATEIAIIAQQVLAHDTRVAEGSVIAVGRPMEGVAIELRRKHGNNAAHDDAGEILVRSRYLSPGYWKRADLDRAAFSSDPGSGDVRTYRSGDLGRLDDDGTLHFLGRAATRVKIRGYTIDATEIEAALLAHADVVGAAIAMAGDAVASTSRLVAYVELRAGAPRDPAPLKRHLLARLPSHMLPAEIRYVAALPRTFAGKLDRLRLAGVDCLPAQHAEVTAPRDAVEAGVAHVYRELLGPQVVGAESDFFLLGGDSLMAGELAARLQASFGVPVGEFHVDATVAGIAARIRRALSERSR